ncbi:hypothetical protein KM043_005075 [Ampulex compressa]|nr:hypothetical protein KM043_005075 [Ampulex compressa]
MVYRRGAGGAWQGSEKSAKGWEPKGVRHDETFNPAGAKSLARFEINQNSRVLARQRESSVVHLATPAGIAGEAVAIGHWGGEPEEGLVAMATGKG